MDDIRLRRVEEQLRSLISGLILGGEIKDPRVGSFVSVTRVEAARDLSYAKVFVSVFPAGPDEAPEGVRDPEDARLALAVAGLGNAAGFIQSRLARLLKTRLTPKLSFIADRGIREGFELNERMKGLFS